MTASVGLSQTMFLESLFALCTNRLFFCVSHFVSLLNSMVLRVLKVKRCTQESTKSVYIATRFVGNKRDRCGQRLPNRSEKLCQLYT
jgi:hypothetical protein